MKKKTKTTFLVVLGILIVSVLGISYAYFVKNPILGNNTNNTIDLGTIDYGQITVTYENDRDTITASMIDLYQGDAGEAQYYFIKFDIQNTGEVAQDVIVKWNNINNEFCQNTTDLDYCDDSGNFVGDELNYALYSCTSQQYAGITSADDADINSCTKITAPTNPAVPTRDKTLKVITLPQSSRTYYVLQVKLDNINGVQNYQMGKTFTGGIIVKHPERIVYRDQILTFNDTDMLAYKMMTDNAVIKHTEPATTTKAATVWIPTENEWKTLVCNSNSSWYEIAFCQYCDSNNANYNATTCSTNYNTAVTSKYVVGENGIFSVTNANGTSYYYRGGEGCSILGDEIEQGEVIGTPEICEAAGGTWSYLNNNVSFAGFNWKIVRINEDGSIRIALRSAAPAASSRKYDSCNNIVLNAANEATIIDYASYAGSDLENDIYYFYETYIDNSATLNTINYSSYLADSTFCSDTTWYSQPAGGAWYFNSYNRRITGTPTYECPSGSTYKVTNSPGETLTYPIATLSFDEYAYAGSGYGIHNTSNYLISDGSDYWTMSPESVGSSGTISILFKYLPGFMNTDLICSYNGARPVLNLKADVLVSEGLGTTLQPYVIGD